MKLDLIDRKILFELDRNSRISFVKLAKKLRISKERLRYRFVALKEEGVIKYLIPIMNVAAAGYLTYELFFKLQNVNQEIKNKMLYELEKNKYIAWIGDLEGNFDIGIVVMVKSRIELTQFMEELNKNYSKFISRKSVSINLKGDFLSRNYLINQERKLVKQSTYSPTTSLIQLDKIDIRICFLLSTDSRTSALEIAKNLKISVDTIIKRIKRLEQSIIVDYTIVLNNSKINQTHYKLLLYSNNKLDEEKMVAFCKMNNRVVAIIKTLAEWDYEVDLEVETVEQLKKFTMELTKVYSTTIKDYDVLQVTNMSKYTFFPG
ncbi:MAG: Lrp/AsnC family transcriptional regulator [Candidatus Woesearchaeota archaeon]|jgi:DNA-binding Lrp family transcriptional regulator